MKIGWARAVRFWGLAMVCALPASSVCWAGVTRPVSSGCATRAQRLCYRIYDYDVQGSCLTDMRAYQAPCVNLEVCESIPTGGADGEQDEAINECLIETRDHEFSAAVLNQCKVQKDKAK